MQLNPASKNQTSAVREAASATPTRTLDQRLVRRRVIGVVDQAAVNLKRRRSGAFVMAVLALAALLFRRSDYDSPVVMLSEMVLSSLAVSMSYWYFRRSSAAATTLAATVFTLAVVSIPWIVDWMGRRMGAGNGIEILMLSSLAWAAVLSAAVGTHQRHISISVILSGFLTLFTTFISENAQAILFAYLWGILCLWWLVSNHWEQVQAHSATEVKAHGGYRFFVLILGCLTFFSITALVSNRVPVIRKLKQELMPTSGGTSQKDSVGRGVGDGDALIAARNHPTSFGAVETDIFLESTKPSLFDVFADEAGAPKRNRRVERAQGIRGEDLKVEGGRFSEANQSSSGNSDFSTARDRPKRREPPANIVKESLMFWAGQSGSRLAVERFTEFDGIDWSNPELDQNSMTERTPESMAVGDQTWFYSTQKSFPNPDSPFIDAVAEALKFTRFRSPVIPTRPGLQMWCVDLLDRADFFAVDRNELVLMPDRLHVPDYTVVRFINSRIDREKLETLMKSAPISPANRLLSSELRDRLAELGRQWSGDLPRGWPQVTAIVDRFRREFTLDRDWQFEASNEQELPLEHFLDQRRGPAYLFATAACQVLRQLGYETRLATGFYTNPRHFLSGQQEIAILPQDAHVWPEVHLGNGNWMPLEPTPGYAPERLRLGFWYWVKTNKTPIISFLFLTMIASAAIFRWRGFLLECVGRVGWLIASGVSDRRRVAWLASLIDWRCRFAGNPRQKGRVLRDHLSQSVENWPAELAEHWRRFLAVADRICFGETSQLDPSERLVVRRVWQDLTFFRIRSDRRQLPRDNDQSISSSPS